ncbi:ABC transporter permease [Mycolicibacterium anyangense]|jgi:phospholipid/cholesterol/gamma-HCH transport system permease protein|uniref:ABC transporter permease n=1 Tax=Mycolicibacterium anyangense TaxID=1431246 RepID=A0A6N4WF54_9MYCO|nr:ABC transporter permease [Mycolicibacterium anyangense]BBZ78807.1 ABC transporter permease [Mycolicibacterium anyangense]
MVATSGLVKPIRGVGEFYAMTLDTVLLLFKPPFQWGELILQFWFVTRVSLVPAVLMAVPFTVLSAFTFNVLLVDFGAVDFAGAATGITLAQLGPIITVLVISGAAATAICADLGARTIREELDAMRVLGINPIHRLVVPRVLATGLVSLLLSGIVSVATVIGSYFFSIFVQGATPGAFAGLIGALTDTTDIVVIMVKSALFGVTASLIGCYKGISVGGGPAGVGSAVNETVIYSFMALFVINLLVTAVQFGGSR